MARTWKDILREQGAVVGERQAPTSYVPTETWRVAPLDRASQTIVPPKPKTETALDRAKRLVAEPDEKTIPRYAKPLNVRTDDVEPYRLDAQTVANTVSQAKPAKPNASNLAMLNQVTESDQKEIDAARVRAAVMNNPLIGYAAKRADQYKEAGQFVGSALATGVARAVGGVATLGNQIGTEMAASNKGARLAGIDQSAPTTPDDMRRYQEVMEQEEAARIDAEQKRAKGVARQTTINKATDDVTGKVESALDINQSKMGTLGRVAYGSLSSLPQMIAGPVVFGLSAAGTYTQEATRDGATGAQALGYGIPAGIAEMTLERVLGVVPGIKGLKNAAKGGLKGFAKNIAGEALEEAITTPITDTIKKLAYSPDTKVINKDTLKTMGEDALGGAMMTVFMTALGFPVNAMSRKVAERTIAKAEREGRELTPNEAAAVESLMKHDADVIEAEQDQTITPDEQKKLYNGNLHQAVADYETALKAEYGEAAVGGSVDSISPTVPADEAADLRTLYEMRDQADAARAEQGEPVVAPAEAVNVSEDTTNVIDRKEAQIADLTNKVANSKTAPERATWQGRLDKAQNELDAMRPVASQEAAETILPEETTMDAIQTERAVQGRTDAVQEAWKPDGSVYTNKNEKVDFKYRIVDASELVASNDESGNANPNYPKELQPRSRDRVASQLQISSIASAINPERLNESTLASEGAPIVGPDMVVESGNGRTIAVAKAYREGKAEEYRKMVADYANRMGIKDVPANPVLVRERTSEVDRVAFVNDANESSVAQMSATELAKRDADMLTPELLRVFEANDDGEINTYDNRQFVSAFIDTVVPSTERNSMLAAEGGLSQNGLARIRNALFFKAYGDTHLMDKVAESTSDDVKRLTNMLVTIAPRLVAIKNESAQGGRFDGLDMADDIKQAASKFESLKRGKMSVKEYLEQVTMEKEISDVAHDILAVFEKKRNSGKQMIAAMNDLLDSVLDAGEQVPGQETLFGEAPKPTKYDIIAKTWGDDYAEARNQISLDEQSKPADSGMAQEEIGVPESATGRTAEPTRSEPAQVAAKPSNETAPKATMESVPKPTAETVQKTSTVTAPSLPKELRGAKPRYKESTLTFESDVDKALYIVGGTNKSKSHDKYMAFLRETMSDEQIRSGSVEMRARVKAEAEGKSGDVRIMAREVAPKTATTPPVVANNATSGPAQSDAEFDIVLKRAIESEAFERTMKAMGYTTLESKSAAASQKPKDINRKGMLRPDMYQNQAHQFEELNKVFLKQVENNKGHREATRNEYDKRNAEVKRAKEVEDSFNKPDWQVPQDVILERGGAYRDGRSVIDIHKEAIAKAIEAGETIPDAVKKDYPELFGNATSEPATVAEAATSADNTTMDKPGKKPFSNSKIVNPDGSLKAVYHGTPRQGIISLRPKSAPGWGSGIYFTDNIEDALNYGENIMKAHLNITNPYTGQSLPASKIESTEAYRSANDEHKNKALIEYGDEEAADLDGVELFGEDGDFANAVLRELGYDGMAVKGSNDITGIEYVVFDNDQIELLDGGESTQAESPQPEPSLAESTGLDLPEATVEWSEPETLPETDAGWAAVAKDMFDAVKANGITPKLQQFAAKHGEKISKAWLNTFSKMGLNVAFPDQITADMFQYDVLSELEQVDAARKEIDADPEAAFERVTSLDVERNGAKLADHNVTLELLNDNMSAADVEYGDFDTVFKIQELAVKASETGREGGRIVQAFQKYGRTATGTVLVAQKGFEQAADELPNKERERIQKETEAITGVLEDAEEAAAKQAADDFDSDMMDRPVSDPVVESKKADELEREAKRDETEADELEQQAIEAKGRAEAAKKKAEKALFKFTREQQEAERHKAEMDARVAEAKAAAKRAKAEAKRAEAKLARERAKEEAARKRAAEATEALKVQYPTGDLTFEEQLAEKIRAYTAQKKQPVRDPVIDMLNELFKKAKESPIPDVNAEAKKARDPIQFAIQALDAWPRYKQVYEDAKTLVAKRYADRPDMLALFNDFFADNSKAPVASSTLSNIIQRGMREVNITLTQAMESADMRKDLINHILESSGVRGNVAYSLRNFLNAHFSVMQSKAKERGKILPEAKLGELFDATLKKAFIPQQIVKVMAEYVTGTKAQSATPKISTKIPIAEIVKDFYNTGNRKQKDLIQTIIDKSGVSGKDATDLRDMLENRMREYRRDYSEKYVAKLIEAKKIRQTRRDAFLRNIVEMANTGAIYRGAVQNMLREKYGLPTLTKGDIAYIMEGMKAYDSAQTVEQQERIYHAILHHLGNKMPRHSMDKWRSWTKTAMLLGAPTHAANIVGNVINYSMHKASDIVAMGIEHLPGVDPTTRTKAILTAADKPIMDKARQDFEAVKDELMRTSDRRRIRNKDSLSSFGDIFKTKQLNQLSELSSHILNTEDLWFFKPAYISAMSQFMKARGLTEITTEAREYAADRAREITFRRISKVAQSINALKRGNGAVEFVVDVNFPFVNTPINIARTGVDFSPLGVFMAVGMGARNAATFGAKKLQGTKSERLAVGLMSILDKVSQENYSLTQIAEQFGKATVGTAFAGGLGFLLSSVGFLELDDDEGLTINVGKNVMTIDWLQPLAMAMAYGAAVYKKMEDGGLTFNEAYDAFIEGSDTLFNMSVFSSIQDMFGGKYGSPTEAMATSPMKSMTQGIPQVSAQIAKTVDPYARSTYVSSDEAMKPFKSVVNQIKARVPALSATLPKRIDALGNEVRNEGPVGLFVLPGRVLPGTKGPIADKINDLRERLKNVDPVAYRAIELKPAPVSFSYDKVTYRMDSRQMEEWSRLLGGKRTTELTTVLESNWFDNLTDSDKAGEIADALSAAYEDAKDEWVLAHQTEPPKPKD